MRLPRLKSLSTGALEGGGVLKRRNTVLILGNLFNISISTPDLRYSAISVSTDSENSLSSVNERKSDSASPPLTGAGGSSNRKWMPQRKALGSVFFRLILYPAQFEFRNGHCSQAGPSCCPAWMQSVSLWPARYRHIEMSLKPAV